MRLTILLLATACATDAPAPTPVDHDAAAPAIVPPPTELTIEGPDFVTVGRPFTVTVDGALEGERTFLLAGREPGEGPCRDLIGGYCLDIAAPVGLHAVEYAGGDGAVSFELAAPPWPGAEYCFQSVIIRGPAGIATGLSGVQCVSFCADEDGDGDGLCDEFDPCVGDGADDDDADGICDALDSCPGGPDWVDSDGDSVCDHLDVCPGYPDELDEDGDGVPDDCESVWGTVEFVATDGVASGCSYDNAHEVSWSNLGSHDWRECMLEASMRRAMVYSNAYTLADGWAGHINGGNAMTSNWSSYTSADMDGFQPCIVGRDNRASRDDDALSGEASHEGLIWAYEDLGSMYYDECQLAAANAGASIITPAVVGLGNGDSYWVNTVHACNTYEYISSAGAAYSYYNLGGYARSGAQPCMIGYAKSLVE